MKPSSHLQLALAAALVAGLAPSPSLHASPKLPAIFGDHMVLQRERANPVWGRADAGEQITVVIGAQNHVATADKDGNWRVNLAPLPAGGPYQLVVQGKSTLTLSDVLVGEVWVCSGQSNMKFAVQSANDPDLESLTAKYPRLRIITVPNVGTQEPQQDFKGQWEAVTPETVKSFSAVGYFFGRTLHQALDVPVGLINNAWGGSAAEAWVRRDVLAADPRYAELLGKWDETAKTYDHSKALAAYEKQRAKWQDAVKKARAEKQTLPAAPRAPRDPLTGQHRPANLYNGVLKPVIGYGIRGAIWYQGESNAGRAYQYRHLFPLMIQHWRAEWKQGDFPFYWVQLADFRDEKAGPAESDWAELREAQTMAMQLPNSGQAVITDLGEAHDIHPKDKQNVAKRLARWALAKDYGLKIVHRSPEYQSLEIAGGKATVTFAHVGGGLDTFDTRDIKGVAIAGEDRKFVWAQARIVGNDKLEVWSPAVKNPVSVRYAWSDNPVCNLQNKEGLAVTPFRTDDWPGVTVNANK